MSARREFSYDLLVTAMHAIKDADGQPGILKVNFFERAKMSHTYKCSQRRPRRWSDISRLASARSPPRTAARAGLF
jgi:hypothetical protein